MWTSVLTNVANWNTTKCTPLTSLLLVLSSQSPRDVSLILVDHAARQSQLLNPSFGSCLGLGTDLVQSWFTHTRRRQRNIARLCTKQRHYFATCRRIARSVHGPSGRQESNTAAPAAAAAAAASLIVFVRVAGAIPSGERDSQANRHGPIFNIPLSKCC